MKTVDNKELIAAMDDLEKEKGIEKKYLLESLEAALITAYKKDYDSAENIKVVIDEITGAIRTYSVRTVVEEVEDEQVEINLKEARKINKNLEVGDTIDTELFPKEFGRIAAQTAKQVIVQKIREAERNIVYDEFYNRKGEIVSGLVQKVQNGTVLLDLGKLEGIMPFKEQISTENYTQNQKIKAYVLEVEKGLKGNLQVVVSRSHPDFVRKLFEFEIPEIYEGLIEIKNVSRDPGARSKVAVYSTNENIDPVGSCVGQKGVRIQNIIHELNGEKIDVIEWDEDPGTFIAAALLPAQVMAVDIQEEGRFAQVIVPDDQLSLAIGKAGQNARLAAKLTNWKVDIKSESQFREMLLVAQEESEKEIEQEESAEEMQEDMVEETAEVAEVEVAEVIVEEVVEKVEVEPAKKTKKKKDASEDLPVDLEKPKKTTKKKTTEKKETKKKKTLEKEG